MPINFIAGANSLNGLMAVFIILSGDRVAITIAALTCTSFKCES